MNVELNCLVCGDRRILDVVALPGEPVPCAKAACSGLIEPQVIEPADAPTVATPWAANPHKHAEVKGHKGHQGY